MNPRKLTNGPRPKPDNKMQSYWHHRRHWPHHHYWHDYDYYDWYDYDYYDWHDYDYDWYDNYLTANKPKGPPSGPRPVRAAEYTDDWSAYQQGFKDGWKAAMDYMMYGTPPDTPIPEPVPPMPPKAPTNEGTA